MTVIAFTPRQDVRLSPRRLARKPLAEVIKLMRDADALYRFACAIDEQDPLNTDRCERMYAAVLLSHPTHAKAMVNLGNIYYRRDSRDHARYLFDEARLIEPDCSEASYNLGVMCLEDGELSDAISLFEIALRLDPSFTDAHTNLAEARSRLELRLWEGHASRMP